MATELWCVSSIHPTGRMQLMPQGDGPQPQQRQPKMHGKGNPQQRRQQPIVPQPSVRHPVTLSHRRLHRVNRVHHKQWRSDLPVHKASLCVFALCLPHERAYVPCVGGRPAKYGSPKCVQGSCFSQGALDLCWMYGDPSNIATTLAATVLD